MAPTMSDKETNLHALDAAYKPFPTFVEWQSETVLDSVRWERYNASLQGTPGFSQKRLTWASQIATRAAALDTGAIEGLYEVDRGFTYSVAFETSAWEVALAQKGENVRPLFEAQLHAYDYVLDLATKAEPISEAAIRVLHEVVCHAQPTYRVMTAVGPQEQPLPKGRYKVLPNHVRTRDGVDHSYAPVDVTPAEMARLVNELRSQAFLAAHPVIQAAYAHYALVVIHPFADGNGRVARALASAFTYRAISMPIVILSEHKDSYLDALESADKCQYQDFVTFMLARSLDTIGLVNESVQGSLGPSVEQSVAGINSLYVTKGGYTQDQVDASGLLLVEAIHNELKKLIAKNTSAKVQGSVSLGPPIQIPPNPTHRYTLSGGGRSLHIHFGTPPPAQAAVNRQYALFVPKNAGGDDDIQLRRRVDDVGTFFARTDEVIPSIAGVLQIRIAMFAERVVGEMLAELKSIAEKSIRNQH